MKDIELKLKEYFKKCAEESNTTVEEIKDDIVTDWGKEGLRGYGLFLSDDTDAVHIERIDDMDIYEGDLEAGEQAEKDGIKLIPIKEVSSEYPYNCYRFLDTKKNRQILKKEGAILSKGE